jgi:hypothetical protein
LHDIERHLLVAHGVQGLLEGAPLDAGKKVGQFVARGQGESLL